VALSLRRYPGIGRRALTDGGCRGLAELRNRRGFFRKEKIHPMFEESGDFPGLGQGGQQFFRVGVERAGVEDMLEDAG
jgi:hypothetical protein